MIPGSRKHTLASPRRSVPGYRDLWRCPQCGERFVTAGLWHSCGKYRLEDLFARSEPHVLRLYRKYEKLVRAIGPIHVIPQKTRIVFQVQVRFAGAVPRRSHLRVGFWLTRKLKNPRFQKVETYTPRAHGHFLALASEDEFDAEFKGWMREAYRIGERKHLVRRKR